MLFTSSALGVVLKYLAALASKVGWLPLSTDRYQRSFELPASAKSSSRSGIAVILLVLSGTLICARTSLVMVA